VDEKTPAELQQLMAEWTEGKKKLEKAEKSELERRRLFNKAANASALAWHHYRMALRERKIAQKAYDQAWADAAEVERQCKAAEARVREWWAEHGPRGA
jgi:hypothetical protein